MSVSLLDNSDDLSPEEELELTEVDQVLESLGSSEDAVPESFSELSSEPLPDPSLPPPSNEAALRRLADFVKKVSRSKNTRQTADSLRAQKIISIYENKLEAPLLQQKGLQLNKAA